MNPEDLAAYINRGNAYYYKGSYDQAIADWRKVLALDPGNDLAKNNIESVEKERGKNLGENSP